MANNPRVKYDICELKLSEIIQTYFQLLNERQTATYSICGDKHYGINVKCISFVRFKSKVNLHLSLSRTKNT